MIKLKYILQEGIKENLVLEFIKNQIQNSKFEHNVYLAGGGVRDELLGKDIKDIDLVIANIPNGGIEFATFITKKLGIYKENTNPIIFPNFGTAKFNLRNITYKGQDLSDIDIECVMTRKEQYHTGSRNPDVEFGTLKDDVERRDFTVNSLLKDLSNNEILDLTGMGRTDIQKGIIRTTLNPDIIFKEDALRMLRAIRFTVKYNWNLPLFMIRAIKNNAPLLKTISKERIQSELNKMLITQKPDVAIRLLKITNLYKYIFPEIEGLFDLKQNKFHKYDAFKHTMEVLKNTPPDLINRLSGLLHDIGKAKTKTIIDSEIHFYEHENVGSEMAREILKKLKYPNEIIDAVYIEIKNHMRMKSAGSEGELVTDKSLRKLKRDLGDHLERTLDLIHADNISHSDDSNMPNQIPNLRTRLNTIGDIPSGTHIKLPINGFDIMKTFNLKPNKQLGDLLKKVEDAYLENPQLTKQQALNIVKKELDNN